ncbi:hypothetical protein CHS0354_004993 [Potamilus streckersoni]|uniref:Uncharacterized protein n=1 Tax=Potamilus streckersoni TaxID=2493646 RepID=A0AAE0SSJ8_9BIVA|nr:hypothetical protein CHS0354_004993 [Potamilus streckersoni]
MRTSTMCFVFGLALIMLLLSNTTADFSRTDCFMECMLEKYRKPIYCECSETDLMHWGKRTPSGYRTRSEIRMPFRYGKRDPSLTSRNSDFPDYDSGFDALGNIQSFRRYDFNV